LSVPHASHLAASAQAARNVAAARLTPVGVATKRPTQISGNLGKIPLSFEENRGQTDPRVAYLARGRDVALFLTPSEAVLSSRNDTLRMKWPGANSKPEIRGMDESAGKSNYLLGSDPKKWVTGVLSFSKVRYGDVYPGVDLVFHGSPRRELELDWVVSPGASPENIRMAFDGDRVLRLSREGDLVVQTRHGEFRQRKPYAYQEVNGRRQRVEAAYVLAGKREAGFRVGPYDRQRPLVIDPVLAYAVLLGGSSSIPPPLGSFDSGNGIAVDAAGSAYVTGVAVSADFPLANPFQASKPQYEAAFVLKLNPAGTALVYSTFLGGNGTGSRVAVYGTSIAVDAAGNAYVTGTTFSGFPVVNAVQPQYSGTSSLNDYGDAFIAKLNPAGSALIFSTYFGGSGDDAGQGIAVDGAGNSYVAGGTNSTDFPTTPGAFQTSYHAQAANTDCHVGPICGHAFAAKFSASGALVYSTLLGGSSYEQGNGIAVDPSGNAYIAGATYSSDFPVTTGAFQGVLKGGANAFLTKLNAGGSGLVFSTYLGVGGEQGNAVAVDGPAAPTRRGRLITVFQPRRAHSHRLRREIALLWLSSAQMARRCDTLPVWQGPPAT
jgi:hypothetical protein